MTVDTVAARVVASIFGGFVAAKALSQADWNWTSFAVIGWEAGVVAMLAGSRLRRAGWHASCLWAIGAVVANLWSYGDASSCSCLGDIRVPSLIRITAASTIGVISSWMAYRCQSIASS